MKFEPIVFERNRCCVLTLVLKKKWFDMIASGEKTFPVVRDLMRRLQDELLPVRVEGDVQWGVNFVEGQRSKVKGQTEELSNSIV